MATLADINKTLQEQNNFLESVQKNTEDNKESVESLVERLTGLSQKEKELEAQRKSKPTSSGGGFSLPSLAGGLGFGLGGLAAGGLIGSLMSGLMKIGKGGILAIAGTYLADAVGDYIESGGGSEELADAARRAIQVGSIASLFGIRFGLIGAAVGAVLNEESIAKIKEIGEQVAGKLPYLATLFEDMGIYVPTLSDVTKTVNDSLDGVIGLMEGDMTKFSTNMAEIAQVFGGLLSIFGIFTGKGKLAALGLAITGLGTAMDYAGEQFGSIGEVLTGAVGGLLFAAFAFRKKIRDFLKRNNLPDDTKEPKPNQKPKPTPIPDETSKKLPTQAEVAEERLKNRQPVKPPKGKTGIGSILDDLFKGGGKVAKIAGKGVLRFIPGVGWALLAADVAEAAGVPVYDSIGDFLSKAFGSQEEAKPAYDDAILRQLRGMQVDNPSAVKEMLQPLPKSTGALDEFSDQYGPSGAFMTPGAGTVLAPQVDASSTSIDQSQSALIKMDPHIGAENPFAIYDR